MEQIQNLEFVWHINQGIVFAEKHGYAYWEWGRIGSVAQNVDIVVRMSDL